MKKGILLTIVSLSLLSAAASAAGPKNDVFKGKLFPPNVILENQAELNLSKDQFTQIKAAVVAVQANVAEHEWDLREAYQSIMTELDRVPIDQDLVLEHVQAALLAENEVKKEQVAMLIKLKNLLNDEQIAFLESVHRIDSQ
jgi:allophanate hydrolase subunit 1